MIIYIYIDGDVLKDPQARWMVFGKIPSFEMDDANWGTPWYPYFVETSICKHLPYSFGLKYHDLKCHLWNVYKKF